jgi:predicted lipid-binding transport protein (Tim44 family)
MMTHVSKLAPFFLILFAVMFCEAGITTDYADARSKFGGRSFSRSTPKKTSKAPAQTQQGKSGFGRGLAGGLLGGAIGGMLLGSMFGAGGSGMGILPLLLLGVAGYFLYKRFVSRPTGSSSAGYKPPPFDKNTFSGGAFSDQAKSSAPPVPPIREVSSLEDGVAEIQTTDPGFDDKYFVEIASDVFFKIQAGWMRRDLAGYSHLLGKQLAGEYDKQFAEMKAKGQINKLESIAIRKVEVIEAGKQGNEDFVTVLFTANLLDYTVDDKTGDVVEGSKTDPVKFAEKWTWARPERTEDWKLEGIDVVED